MRSNFDRTYVISYIAKLHKVHVYDVDGDRWSAKEDYGHDPYMATAVTTASNR